MVKTCFKIYNLGKNTQVNYNAANDQNPDNIKIDNGIFNMYAYQVFDEFIGVNP